ncbi:MAG: glycoside hydrolase family 3 N-terminal domain-containing protein [Candidatus Pacearchaeota archaeon]|nr:glycoside hydrolase family 3 N-terminal domain-containing protein [Candidatus Pacearchaeota archaeon]
MSIASAQTINLSEISLHDKIAQMIIVSGNKYNEQFTEIGIGGIIITPIKEKDEQYFKELIEKYQKNSKIKLFISADMEGYWNPFEKFYQGKSFGDTKNKKEAYLLGKEHGKILKELGFNINFSPVVEPADRNKIWPGRSFSGTKAEINEKIRAYIEGLHEYNISATAKHYPGGSMIKNPHWRKYTTEIFPEDLEYFQTAIDAKVDAIMIGHPIVFGEVDSNGKPSTVSPEIIHNLKNNFTGLIISDAISMLGLKLSYLFKKDKMYIDLINAGNDIIIDMPLKLIFGLTNPKEIERKIKTIEKAVKDEKISEKRINESVKKILKTKGYKIVE